MPLPSGLSVAMMFIRFRVVALLTLIALVGLAANRRRDVRVVEGAPLEIDSGSAC